MVTRFSVEACKSRGELFEADLDFFRGYLKYLRRGGGADVLRIYQDHRDSLIRIATVRSMQRLMPEVELSPPVMPGTLVLEVYDIIRLHWQQ